MKYFLLACCCCCGFLLSAQSTPLADDGPAYVQGPVYKVINASQGPVILWEGRPVVKGQVVNTAPDLLTVYPPNDTEARLLVYLRPDGRMKRVVDLAYEHDPRKKGSATESEEVAYDNAGPLELTFKNGMHFTYENGVASAYLDGEWLTVTGRKGAYRIQTDTFEAGVSFRAVPGSKVYWYFKDL